MTDDNDTSTSPLASVDPMSIEELQNLDLNELTPKDMDRHLEKLIPVLRAKRKEVEKRDNKAHRGGRFGKGPMRSLPGNLDTLDDLELE